MFNYWRDKRTGLGHISLVGTGWPSVYYELITEEEYHKSKTPATYDRQDTLDINYTDAAQLAAFREYRDQKE